MKIQPEQYGDLRESLFLLFLDMCKALPCPECSEHAMAYMKKKTSPETVEKFRFFLWEFHNVVNIRTKKPCFSPEVLLKYNNTPLPLSFQFLQHAWINQPFNPHLIPKQMLIKQTIQKMKVWLIEHEFIT